MRLLFDNKEASMKRCLTIAAAGLFSVVSAMAGPLRPAEVSKDAKWVAHLDVEQLKAGQIGQYLLQQASTEEMNRKAAAFILVCGFDPRKDISSITAYGNSGQPEQGVMILRGVFDQNRLVTLAQANEDYEGITYGNYTIHSWVDKKKCCQRMFGVVHGGNALLLSKTQEEIKAALDVLDGRAPGMDAATAQALTPKGMSPFFVGKGDSPNSACAGCKNLAIGATGEMMLAEQAGFLSVRMKAKAKDEEAASLLFDMINGSIAWLKASAENMPECAEVARAIQLSKDGDSIQANAQIPVGPVMKLLDWKIAKAKAAREARRVALQKRAMEKTQENKQEE